MWFFFLAGMALGELSYFMRSFSFHLQLLDLSLFQGNSLRFNHLTCEEISHFGERCRVSTDAHWSPWNNLAKSSASFDGLLGGLAIKRACYGVLGVVTESGANGCEVHEVQEGLKHGIAKSDNSSSRSRHSSSSKGG
ncbi:hypothetical protein BUALT_Bualt13G0083700 [Buddleja alternifolia]|uniref:Uncharacterized protein n=1 Tax=Buddleja alternifolia TaxID=168488 RepID=A0AAV6WL12_9LAMI|nr:hypothetical protein BUALT_Bualt13G0083700 [Buddleja alternifolia]